MLRFVDRILNAVLVLGGLVFFTMIGLAFTNIPWRVREGLCTDGAELEGPPEFIVVLGEGGVPGRAGLARAYHAAVLARTFADARVVVAQPGEEDDPNSGLRRMLDELALRGVPRRRIWVEPRGANLREQAANIRTMLRGEPRVLVVTTPDQTKRVLRVLRKAGFAHAAGGPAFNEAEEVRLAFGAKVLATGDQTASDPQNVLSPPDEFWNNLDCLTRAVREHVALGYYRFKGWI
ncbi:MAG: YdcF family protein [Kiritimatiellae bacterium]|nr:YdcF family protein [Kiritimatiellia bacterium]